MESQTSLAVCPAPSSNLLATTESRFLLNLSIQKEGSSNLCWLNLIATVGNATFRSVGIPSDPLTTFSVQNVIVSLFITLTE